MQRINLFPNPVFAGPLTGISHWGGANGTVRDNAVHITGANGGYGFNVAVPFNVPLVLSMRVNASEDNVAGLMIIQTTDKPEINNMLGSQRFKRGISDVLHRFTVTSHGFRFEVNPNGIRDVAVSNVLIERADTYDIAVGGASGLLLGGHDAAQLTQAELVMPDDGHEYHQQSESHDHSESRHVDEDNQHPAQGRHGILLQCLSARQWRFRQGGLLRGRGNKLRSTCQLQHYSFEQIPDRHVLQRRVRQSDRHRDRHAPLHVGRISGKQDPARQHQLFRRGQHAARLTLLGVTA